MSHSRKTMLYGIMILAVLFIGAILLVPSFLTSLTGTVFALYLKIIGQTAALPLYAFPCAYLLAVLFSVLSFILCKRNAGFYSALTVCIVIVMMLWIMGKQDLFVYCLPAIAALVMLYATSTHDELPIKRVVPISLVLVLIAFLLTPANGLISPPLQEGAQKVRQAIEDYFFFSQPRNVFSLVTEGYYPNGSDQLGGKADPQNHPVMQVQTDKTAYLRGTVKDEYTGRSWHDSTGGKRYLYDWVGYQSIRNTLQNRDLPKKDLVSSSFMEDSTLTVKMVSDSTSTLFLPQRVQQIEPLSSNMVLYFNNASEVFITRDLVAGDLYRVKASILQAGQAGVGAFLSACEQANNGETTLNDYQRYIALPAHMETSIYELAATITEQYHTPYEKALALQEYLMHYYRYTLEPDPLPGNVDFVSYFLLRGKEGYCTYFASALTVLCRMIDLPARYVEGYIARPDASGLASVTGLDAHAWTEVYFDGFGWLTFDATPPQQQETDVPPSNSNTETPDTPDDSDDKNPSFQEEPSPEPAEAPTPEPSPEPSSEPSSEPMDTPKDNMSDQAEDDNDSPPWYLWLIAIVVIALISLRIYWMLPKVQAKRKQTLEEQYAVWIQAIFDAIYLRHVKKQPGETLLAYAERLDTAFIMQAAITPIAQVLSHLRYSTHQVESEYVTLAKATYLQIDKQMSWLQKIPFHLYRSFTSKRKMDYASRLN